MKTVYDKIIVTLGLLALLVLWGMCNNVFAGGVTDDNNGNQGYIFVSTGENNGANSVGHWTDPATMPELKGEKGDTGAQGVAGQDGINGIDGKDGLNGVDGAKGDKGDQGIQGIQGFKGDIGLTGDNGKDVDPATVTNLQNNINSEASTRASADNALSNRMDSLSNRLSKLERTQFVAEFDFRMYDSKRLTISPFFRTNFTRGKVDTVGVRFTIKLGKSYEEKLIDKQNKRLEALEQKIGHSPVITKVVDEKGNTKSISITENGLVVNGTF